MRFTYALPDPGTDWCATFHSETGVWSFGIWPALFGYRVRACRVGAPSVVIDYCAADQTAFLCQLLLTVQSILEQLPEDLTEAELERIMPSWSRRPINFDPCWPQLLELAAPGAALARLQQIRFLSPSAVLVP